MTRRCVGAGPRPATVSLGERGSGSVLAAGIVGAVVLLGVALSWLLAVVLAGHRAEAAADLSAIAAAERAALGGPGVCSVAAGLAASNGARLDGCAVGGDGVVAVRVSVRVGIAVPLAPARVAARSRAGPGP